MDEQKKIKQAREVLRIIICAFNMLENLNPNKEIAFDLIPTKNLYQDALNEVEKQNPNMNKVKEIFDQINVITEGFSTR